MSDSRRTLSQQIESACAISAQLYADGADTTHADAEVDRLMAEFDAPTILEMAAAFRGVTTGSLTADQFRAIMRASREARGDTAHEIVKAQALTAAYGCAA